MLISSRDELKLYAVDGQIKEPVSIKPGSSIMGVDFLTSLKNINCDGKFSISGLKNVENLNGLLLPARCVLSGLENVTVLENLKLGKNAKLKGLHKLERIESSFISADGGGLWDLTSLAYISPFVMWPKRFTLSGMAPLIEDEYADIIRPTVSLGNI